MVFKKRTAYKSRKSGSTSRSRKLNSRRLRQHQRRLRSRRGRVHRVGGNVVTVTVHGKNLNTNKKQIMLLQITSKGELSCSFNNGDSFVQCTELSLIHHNIEHLKFTVNGTPYRCILYEIIANIEDEDYETYMRPFLVDKLQRSDLFDDFKD